jgi:hypothetical protein
MECNGVQRQEDAAGAYSSILPGNMYFISFQILAGIQCVCVCGEMCRRALCESFIFSNNDKNGVKLIHYIFSSLSLLSIFPAASLMYSTLRCPAEPLPPLYTYCNNGCVFFFLSFLIAAAAKSCRTSQAADPVRWALQFIFSVNNKSSAILAVSF